MLFHCSPWKRFHRCHVISKTRLQVIAITWKVTHLTMLSRSFSPFHLNGGGGGELELKISCMTNLADYWCIVRSRAREQSHRHAQSAPIKAAEHSSRQGAQMWSLLAFTKNCIWQKTACLPWYEVSVEMSMLMGYLYYWFQDCWGQPLIKAAPHYQNQWSPLGQTTPSTAFNFKIK